MTILQIEAVLKLLQLKDSHGLIGIKGSFQDEGATFDQMIRLKQWCNQADTKLTLKIGGAEARRDIVDSTTIGVKGLVAPMIQTPFALQKFMHAVIQILPQSMFNNMQFYINIQTITGVENIESILSIPQAEFLHGVTVGRHDLIGSLGLPKKYINNQQMYRLTSKVFKEARLNNMKCCLGGGISKDSDVFIQQLFQQGLLDKVQTRYIMFDPALLLKRYGYALRLAQEIQIDLLLSRAERNQIMFHKNKQRIQMLEDRLTEK